MGQVKSEGLGLSGGWVSDAELEIHLSGGKFRFKSFRYSKKKKTHIIVLEKVDSDAKLGPAS